MFSKNIINVKKMGTRVSVPKSLPAYKAENFADLPAQIRSF